MRLKLDPGEQEAIALALELRADGLLIDERKGRLASQELKVPTYGTLAVLQIASGRQMLNLRSAVERLEGTSFRIDSRILARILSPNR